jgi:hypothetical protein
VRKAAVLVLVLVLVVVVVVVVGGAVSGKRELKSFARGLGSGRVGAWRRKEGRGRM